MIKAMAMSLGALPMMKMEFKSIGFGLQQSYF